MTRRRKEEDLNDVGQDSFLDIVANIVGILIILVMVVVVRTKNAPVQLSIAGPQEQATQRELDQESATEQRLHRAVLETAAKIREVELAKRVRDAERSRLALLSTAAEKMIAERRRKLDTEARSQFDRRRKLAEARAELDALENQYELASRIESEPVRVESYPTPLSQMVHGQELHLQLRGGRVTVLPWDEIVEGLKAEFQQNINRMRRQDEWTSRIGPIGGFRVSFTIRRHDVSMREYEKTGAGGSYIRLERFSLIPVSTQLGEPLDVALKPDSELRRALARTHPRRTTVTAWVYPDSFEEFRQLKKELFHLGYATAGRPLPEGELIGGSPNGSRSAAQ